MFHLCWPESTPSKLLEVSFYHRGYHGTTPLYLRDIIEEFNGWLSFLQPANNGMGAHCRFLQTHDGRWIGRSGLDAANLDGRVRFKIRRVKRFIQYSGVQADDVLINVECANIPVEMGGQLIISSATGKSDAS